MTNRPSPIPRTGQLDSEIEDLRADAAGLVQAGRALNTRRANHFDWHHFTTWCTTHRLAPLPADPETVVLYLADLSKTYKTSTITRRLATISIAHQAAGLPTPTREITVKATINGIRRVNGSAQTGKAPLLTEQIRKMVGSLPDTLTGSRDRALLLLGFAGAFRRSELVALTVDDITHESDGLVICIRRSKTDQTGNGRIIGIPYGCTTAAYCPVRSYKAWLTRAQISEGPVFRPIDRHGHLAHTALTDKSVATIIKRAARGAGIDADPLAGHSLRSGMATSAARAGATEAEIMNVTGHHSTAMVRRYIRRGTLFEHNASARLGL
jgi:site-specific recombinase XerD